MNELPREPLWYKDAVVYQLHVRSFADSNGDGTGDFDGLTGRLDYLVDLGVDTIWLLPFFPSPLRDDGYDIADYGSINPVYGDLAAFRRFLRAAHARGLRVIIELVMNHTSDQHPWFQRARRAPKGSRHRDYYVWSDTADRYGEARVIFQDYETSNWTWDPVAQQHYWHRFYSHQPDLNFENPDVRRAMFATLDRWLRMGVDGVRLDAVPYLFEAEGTNCENLPATHAFLKDLRRHVDEHFPDRLLLAEANQWPEDAVAYFGDGDECHMAFHFPVMPRLFMALQMESRTPIVDILEQTPDIPDTCQWAMFLRNHDELTLEMVTDEERDYMYRRFAGDPRMRVNLGIRRRLGPLLGDDRRKMELLNALLFSLPGTPIVYYGDEIGMGDNVYLGDRDAVRTPMQWNGDRNAGFSQCEPNRLFLPVIIDSQHHYEAINVEAQRRNPSSLWWRMRRLIALRRRHQVFGRGRMVMIDSDNPKVLTFLRTLGDGDDVLVVANLSRHVQQTRMVLPDHSGVSPVELFGQTAFDPIGDGSYRITIGPHDFYWLRLRPAASIASPVLPATSRELALPLTRPRETALAELLPQYLTRQRWFGDRDRTITDISLGDHVTIDLPGRQAVAVFAQVEFDTGEPQNYFLPLAESSSDDAADALVSVVAHLGDGDLVDAGTDPAIAGRFVRMIGRSERLAGSTGTLVGTGALDQRPDVPSQQRRRRLHQLDSAPVRPLGAEQSNSSSIIGDTAVLKVLRRVEAGLHPEVEVLQHLQRVGFQHSPALLGTLDYRPHTGAPLTLATLIEFVPSDGDTWGSMRNEAARFYEWAAAERLDGIALPDRRVVGGVPATGGLPEPLVEALDRVELLGRRTADLHLAMARGDDPRFRPEPFSRLYQRSLYQSVRTEARQVFAQLRRRSGMSHDVPTSELADGERNVLATFARLTDHLLDTDRIRIHGDLHLAQVLGRGGEVTFIDFEGEPARPLGERSIKRSGLVDVAGMIRSFDYVAHQALADATARGIAPAIDLEPAAELWSAWTQAAYAASYVDAVAGTRLVPSSPDDVALLLQVFTLHKAIYEVRYELGSRPEWLHVPLRALLRRSTAVPDAAAS
jgi:maltose alpha-D-glucosyltransferase/alpha-amylase